MNPRHFTAEEVFEQIVAEASKLVKTQPWIDGFIEENILSFKSFKEMLLSNLAKKICSEGFSKRDLLAIFESVFLDNPFLVKAAIVDLFSVFERDPACGKLMQPLLYFKGYKAIQVFRIAHCLYEAGDTEVAYFLQMRMSEIFCVDIHPAAKIGVGIMVDHAHSVVIGETASVGDNVSILHSVTLGGTGKNSGDRHPKIGDGVLIGAGASVLGNIVVGKCSRIASGSVVLSDVPDFTTVAGVPAKIVGKSGCDQPSVSMDQILDKLDD